MGNLFWVLGVTRTASPEQCHQDSMLLRQDPQTERRWGNASSWLGYKHPGASGKSHERLKGRKAAACPGQRQHPHPCPPSWPRFQVPGPISGEVTLPASCPPSLLPQAPGESPQVTVQLGKAQVGRPVLDKTLNLAQVPFSISP